MKTLICSWIILGVTTVGAFANPGTKKISKAKPQVSLEQQLANQLTYPVALQKATGNGVVVIQFRLADNNKLVNPTVFTDNKQLNDELTQQLMNAKLSLPESGDSEQVHTARLRFKASE
ncbi:hypothetical protein [Fibrella aquatica]|jgi:hypothetical protein|uniref:hypothetical protein n=1 Tax=Fibrella aquatica TaxID=3242487 RepID=UPI003522125C